MSCILLNNFQISVHYIAHLSIIFHILALLKRGQRLIFCKGRMIPSTVGQKVKYHTPYPDKDTEQVYLVLEVKAGLVDTRNDISPLNIGLEFPSVYTIKSEDLVVVDSSQLNYQWLKYPD